jgi:hypothetical protein
VCTANGLGIYKCYFDEICGNPFNYSIPLSLDEVGENA